MFKATSEIVIFISFNSAGSCHRCHRGQEAKPSPETADDRDSPPEKKSAVAELFGELFTTQEEGTKSKVIEEEVTSYREVDCIPLDADPLIWWKTKELLYPHVAMLARCYLAVHGTSVPSERVFSTATWLCLGPLSLARGYSPQLPGCVWDLCP